MKKIILVISLIFLSALNINSQLAKSKFRIGNEFFDNILEVLLKKLFQEVNKHSIGLPEMNMGFKLAKFIPINASLKNFTFSELQYKDDQFVIEHLDGEIVTIKISKIFLIKKNLISRAALFCSTKFGSLQRKSV